MLWLGSLDKVMLKFSRTVAAFFEDNHSHKVINVDIVDIDKVDIVFPLPVASHL